MMMISVASDIYHLTVTICREERRVSWVYTKYKEADKGMEAVNTTSFLGILYGWPLTGI